MERKAFLYAWSTQWLVVAFPQGPTQVLKAIKLLGGLLGNKIENTTWIMERFGLFNPVKMNPFQLKQKIDRIEAALDRHYI